MPAELVDLTLICLHETPAAYKVSDGGTRIVWLPKSQCERYDCVGEERGHKIYEFAVPVWLAQEKELV